MVGFDERADFFAFRGELEVADGMEMADFVVFAAVGGGDLEAVEQQAGALGIDLVGGKRTEDFGENHLDGGAVFEHGQGESGGGRNGCGGSVGDSLGGGDGEKVAAGLKMEIAETVTADGDGGALLAAGTDVLALVEFGFLSGRHGYAPPPRVGWAGFVCFQ